MARKALSDNATDRIALRLSAELRARCEAVAADLGLDLSNYIRMALTQAVRRAESERTKPGSSARVDEETKDEQKR